MESTTEGTVIRSRLRTFVTDWTRVGFRLHPLVIRETTMQRLLPLLAAVESITMTIVVRMSMLQEVHLHQLRILMGTQLLEPLRTAIGEIRTLEGVIRLRILRTGGQGMTVEPHLRRLLRLRVATMIVRLMRTETVEATRIVPRRETTTVGSCI